MISLWEGFLASLALAMISGLTFIAYRHPAGYRRLYLPIVYTVWAVWLGRLIYTLGETSGFYSALTQIHTLNPKQLIQTPSIEGDPWWVFLVPVVIVVYLGLLRSLPFILGEDTQSDSPEIKNEKQSNPRVPTKGRTKRVRRTE